MDFLLNERINVSCSEISYDNDHQFHCCHHYCCNWRRLESSDLLMHGNLTDTSSYKECFSQLIIIRFFFSLKDYLENNDSASETVVWEFLVDLSLVSTFNFNSQVRFEFVGFPKQ